MKHLLFLGFIALALIPIQTSAATLSPSVMEVSGVRGSVVSQTLTVINTKAMEQTYYVGVLSFGSQGEGGNPVFFSQNNQPNELVTWIELPFEEFRVPANATGEIPFQIRIPSGAKSGGYYAAITISQAPSEVVATNGATIEAKTAALIFLTVQGETQERLALLDFRSDNTDPASQLGGMFTYRVQNQGNVHVAPRALLTLTDFFGRTLIKTDANPTSGRVLPGSTRAYEFTLETQDRFFWILKDQMGFFAVGPIKATLDLTYGEQMESIQSTLTFWYLPWQLFMVITVLLVVLWLLICLPSRRSASLTPHS